MQMSSKKNTHKIIKILFIHVVKYSLVPCFSSFSSFSSSELCLVRILQHQENGGKKKKTEKINYLWNFHHDRCLKY